MTHRHVRSDSIGPDTVLYLSGPMSGHPEFNFPAFEAAAKSLRERGVKVVSAHEVRHKDNGIPGSIPWEEYLRADLQVMLTDCNAIILLPFWYESKGAQLEAFMAHSLNWPTFYYRSNGAVENREGEEVLS